MAGQARYVLAKKIGRGGMAEIFLGKQVGEDGFQRLCAIKRILPHYSQDKEFIQMFRDEAHICKRLQHANIVRVEGFEEVEGSYAIIMEYIDGSDLRSILHACEQAKKRPSIPMVCYIAAEAARGLHYAHTKVDEITQQPLGIVHRDISPQNIMLSFEGEVKVMDFGIADAESKMTETRPGIVKGKYSYMSPEQISAKTLDARSDVFALSIVLWEAIAMRRLFQGENEVETIQLVKNCKIDTDLRKLNPNVDDDLVAIIGKGLAKEPKKRYSSAASFEKALRRYMSRIHPDFTPDDLGDFLKSVLDKKRAESAADIKRTLTETNLKAAGKRPGRKRHLDLSLDDAKGPALQVARAARRPIANSRSTQNKLPSAKAAGRSSLSRGSPNRNYTGMNGAYGRRSSNQAKVAIAGIFVAALALLTIFTLREFAAQPPAAPARIYVSTNPSPVRISIDGKLINNGEYVTASRRDRFVQSLKPGRHRIVIRRKGYRALQREFVVEPGEKLALNDLRLRRGRNPAGALRIQLAKSERGAAKINIEGGFYRGTLRGRGKNYLAPDLHLERYVMTVTKGSRRFNCTIRPKSTSTSDPDIVIVSTKRKTCKFIAGGGGR